jgi:hypothetical protein
MLVYECELLIKSVLYSRVGSVDFVVTKSNFVQRYF